MTSTFHDFKVTLDAQMTAMSAQDLFTVIVDKDEMWEEYLASFPPDSNPIHKERTVHDCQCCKQFIRAAGAIVVIRENSLESIWDVAIAEPYATVAKQMSAFIKARVIDSKFLSKESFVGTDHNREMGDDGKVITYEHFHFKLPPKAISQRVDRDKGASRSNYAVLKRALDEISFSAVSIVLELIEQGSLYRGAEHKPTVQLLSDLKRDYKTAKDKHLFAWERSAHIGAASGIRNTVIGTLLVDISKGVSLDDAVRMFETKVAPQNYKRPTALITKLMIERAKAQIEELGLTTALARRYAKIDDIEIRNAIFVYRDVQTMLETDVFADMAAETSDSYNLSKVDEVDWLAFIHAVIPNATKVELLLENEHENSLVSLIAPADSNAKRMFKWNNPYSWTYNGDVADSIKARVKTAGGIVTGDLRCSLSWFNTDDLDLHVSFPGYHIYHANKRISGTTCCNLDVDMNIKGNRRDAVENITWPNEHKIAAGEHRLFVNNYTHRENKDFGFEAEIEFKGAIHKFAYPKIVKEAVTVAKFFYSKDKGIVFTETLPRVNRSKTIWGLTTNKFHTVSLITRSPNYWNDNNTGNAHLFFVLKDCKNDKPTRGFLNEYLTNDLNEHRKVFEVLGSKTKAPVSDEQLSGVGFSSTLRRSAYFRVTGSFSRIIKVNF